MIYKVIMKYIYEHDDYDYAQMINMLSHKFVWDKNERSTGWLTGSSSYKRHYKCLECEVSFCVSPHLSVRGMRDGKSISLFEGDAINSCDMEKKIANLGGYADVPQSFTYVTCTNPIKGLK